jgi:hypothetical protein
MTRRIQLRRDTASNWTAANPILSAGEIGIDLTAMKLKIGNGTDSWTVLDYLGGDVDLSNYATTQYVDDEIGALIIPDVSNFITAEDIPAIPEDISELTDESNLLGQLAGTSLGHLEVTDRITLTGNPVSFTKLPNTSTSDPIDVGLELTRPVGIGAGLINIAVESTWNTETSPAGTEWNWDGWSNLDDVKLRTYASLRQTLKHRIGENIVGAELIMHDIANDKYYKMQFTSWAQGPAHTGAFAYTRQLIDTTIVVGINFADGSALVKAPKEFVDLPQIFSGDTNEYILGLGDRGKHVYAFTESIIKIPTDAQVNFPIGSTIFIATGVFAANKTVKVSCTAPTVIEREGNVGATLWNLRPYSTAMLIKIAENKWNLSGSVSIPSDISNLSDTNNLLVNLNSVDQNIIPAADITYDLGSPTKRFRDLYLSGNTINLGNQTISLDNSGNIRFSGNIKANVVTEKRVVALYDGRSFMNGTIATEVELAEPLNLINPIIEEWLGPRGTVPAVYESIIGENNLVTGVRLVSGGSGYDYDSDTIYAQTYLTAKSANGRKIGSLTGTVYVGSESDVAWWLANPTHTAVYSFNSTSVSFGGWVPGLNGQTHNGTLEITYSFTPDPENLEAYQPVQIISYQTSDYLVGTDQPEILVSSRNNPTVLSVSAPLGANIRFDLEWTGYRVFLDVVSTKVDEVEISGEEYVTSAYVDTAIENITIPADISDLTDTQGLLGQGGVGGSLDRLTNGVENELRLEEDGTVTLPDGGTITEGVVTENPTIELTPSGPEAESQKLVIKGGGPTYSNTENGITINTYSLTVSSGNLASFTVDAPDFGGETFYWWVDIYSPGEEFTPDNGEITLDEFGFALIEFTVNDDTVPLRIYVADTLYNAYINGKGAGSIVVNDNSEAADLYHLHLTTGDLQETSVFLGTDEHNVRTRIDGSVELTSYDYDGEQTYRLNFKNNVLKISSTDNEGDEDLYIKAEDDLYLDALDDDIHIRASDDIRLRPGYDFEDDEPGWEVRFTNQGDFIFYNQDEGNTYGTIRQYNNNGEGPRSIELEGNQDAAISTNSGAYRWKFDGNGDLTLPNQSGKINSSVSDGVGLQVEATLDFEIRVNDGEGGSNIWSFAGSDITFPDGSIQTTAYTGSAGGTATDIINTTSAEVRIGSNGYEVEFVGSISNGFGDDSGATLTVTEIISGTIIDGMTIYGDGLPSEGWVLTFDSGLLPPVGTGGTGNYLLAGANYLISSQSFNNNVLVDTKVWTFGTDGILEFPNGTQQYTAWSGGRVVEVPTTSVGAEGDKAGDIAFSPGHLYYCFEDYDSGVSYNTTLSNITEDDNKFIFAKDEGIIEPEIGWSITVDVDGLNEETHTITNVEDLATDWRVAWSGGTVTFNPGTAIRIFSTNIWKRVIWSNDTW